MMDQSVILVIVLLLGINLVSFAMYGIDKAKARRGAWRISEKALLTAAALFGGMGAFVGMRVFRHKTQHLKFTITVPLLMAVQLALILFAIFWCFTRG